jgi:ferredoxin
MTISVTEYFATRQDDRKKETRYLNVINKDSCTSCQSCATVCPVDCIFEVPSPIPGQSYHQIDTSRCIGCQMCYRSPSDSSDRYTLTICPWNAIDMLHNPNVKPDDVSVFQAYWKGDADAALPYPKLEEYGYQLFLDGEVFLPADREDLIGILDWFTKPHWLYTEDGDTVAIAEEYSRDDQKVCVSSTNEGRALLDCIFAEWHRIWMD